jgi:hypothetical protein
MSELQTQKANSRRLSEDREKRAAAFAKAMAGQVGYAINHFSFVIEQ